MCERERERESACERERDKVKPRSESGKEGTNVSSEETCFEIRYTSKLDHLTQAKTKFAAIERSTLSN